MTKNKWDISSFPIVSQTEIENDFDAVLDRIKHGEGPFVILGNDGQRMVLIDWDEYWNHFGVLHPPGERERVEEECRKQQESCKERD